MNDIRQLREEILRRRAAQPEPETRGNTMRYVLLASCTIVGLVAAAVTLL